MSRFNWLVSRAEEIIIGTLIFLASLILFSNVVARYLFNAGFPWAEEVVRYQIVWMVFLGASVAAREGIHIGVDILAKFSPPSVAKLIRLLVNLISVVFALMLVFFGADLISQTRMFGQVSPALQVPMWLVQLAIPVGGGLMAIRFAQAFVAELFGNQQQEQQLENIG